LLYFNMRRRLIYMIPALLLFSIYVAPQLVSTVLYLVGENTGFAGATLISAIDIAEPVSFRAGMNTSFFFSAFPELALTFESSVGKVLVELGFLYATPLLLAAGGMLLYSGWVFLQGFRHRTSNNLCRSAVAALIVVTLLLCVKGLFLEVFPQSPYLFILIGILAGSRASPEKAKVSRGVSPLAKGASSSSE
jgi:hypothetical protein